MEVLTTQEVVDRIKPSLLLPDDFDSQDKWLLQQVSDLSLVLSTKVRKLSKGTIKLDLDTIPLDLFMVIKNIVVFAFNRQRSEGLDTHTEGGEVMRWKKANYDPFEEYSTVISDFVEGTDYASGFRFYS